MLPLFNTYRNVSIKDSFVVISESSCGEMCHKCVSELILAQNVREDEMK